MIDLYYLEETVQTLKQHKVRSVLTGFGVMWGIFSLILLLGMGEGLKDGVFRKFEGLSRNTITILGRYDKNGQRIVFDTTILQNLKKNFPFIKHLSPESHNSRANYIAFGQKTFSAADIYGVAKEYCEITNLDILANGRNFNDLDFWNERKVCIIGERVVEEIFNGIDPIGKIVNVAGTSFKVIGVIEGGKGFNSLAKNNVLLPFGVFQSLFRWGSEIFYGPIKILLTRDVDANKAQDKILDYLYNYFGIHPQDRENTIKAMNVKKDVDKINNLFRTIDLFIWFIGICFLISGAVGIGNMMLVVIKERTKEIGIRKVIGAKPIEILSMIITESVFITLSSGIVGMIIGMGSIQIMNLIITHIDKEKQMMIGHLSLSPIYGIVSILILIIFGALAGWIPARKATKLLPIKALSEE